MTSHRLVIAFLALLLVTPPPSLANNGGQVSFDHARAPLYYRICGLHQIPIRYYIDGSLAALVFSLNGVNVTVHADVLARTALARWRQATAEPGQQPACMFEQVETEAQADLVFRIQEDNLPPSVDSYLIRQTEVRHIIVLIPRRLNEALRTRRILFADTPVQPYVDSYIATRLLHLTGHAFGLDHPGLEQSPDVTPAPNPRTDRWVFVADDLAEGEWTRPHVMMTDSFSFLLDLEHFLQTPLSPLQIWPAQAENEAARHFLTQEWQCPMPPSARDTQTAALLSAGAAHCLPHPAALAWPSAVGLLLN